MNLRKMIEEVDEKLVPFYLFLFNFCMRRKDEV